MAANERRQGIGKSLMTKVLSFAKERKD
ncbi:GNAT family N-acetyltransferase [Bacillus xiamenensis]